MTSIVPSNNRDLPDPATGVAGNVPVLQSNGTTSWGSNLPSGLSPLGAASTLLGMNLAGNSLEYKTLTSTDGAVAITNTANNIDLKVGTTTYTDTVSTTLTATSATNQIANHTSGTKAFTLPLASTCPGKMISFIHRDITGVAQTTVARQGSDVINNFGTTAFLSTRALEPFVLVSDGISKWLTVVGQFGENMVRATSSNYVMQPLPAERRIDSATLAWSSGFPNIQLLYTTTVPCVVTVGDASTAFQNFGKLGIFKRMGPNLVTLNRSGSNTFRYKNSDAVTTFTLPSDGSWATIQSASNGVWHVLDGSDDVLSQFTPEIVTTSAAASITLTAASIGNQYCTHSSGTVTFTLPLANTCGGKSIRFVHSNNGGSVNIIRQGADVMNLNETSIFPWPLTPMILTSDGINSWTESQRSLGSNFSHVGFASGSLLQPLPGRIRNTSPQNYGQTSEAITVLDTVSIPITVNLPAGSTVGYDKLAIFKRVGANLVTINRGSTDTLRYKSSDALTSMTLPSDGSYVVLSYITGSSTWSVIGGSDDVLSQFGGSNSVAFTGTTSAMVAGTVTVADTRIRTGDIIQATRVSGAGVSSGITSYSIVNATSFTLNGVATDDGVYSYIVIRP